MKILLNSVWILLIIFGNIRPLFSQESYANLVKRIQPAVVTIITLNSKAKPIALGSGFFINNDGSLITNYHVIQGAYAIVVKASDGSIYEVKGVTDEDKKMDIAILSVDIAPNKIYSLRVNQIMPEVGDRVIVLGSPLGLEQTVSDGLVSAIRNISEVGEVFKYPLLFQRGQAEDL